jgi:hypothetical protein
VSKALDLISKLLAQAEGASTEHERDAFNEKAQSLATQIGIELEIARRHQKERNRRETPVQEAIKIGDRGAKNLALFVELFDSIGRQNDVKINVAMTSTYVYAFGFPSDIEVVQALYGSLLLQMTSAADEALKAGKHKEPEAMFFSKTYPYAKRSDGRVYRSSFYKGFTSEISTRLRRARQQAEAAKVSVAKDDFFGNEGEVDSGEVVETTGALVLAKKKEEVDSYYKETSNARGSWKGGNYTHSSGARDHGHAAGASARLSGPKGAIGTPKPVTA